VALRIKRTRRSTRRTYTPPTRSSTVTRTRTGKGSYTTTRSESVTPATSETSQSGGTPYPSYQGADNTHAGLAILMASGLFLMATWHDLGSPFIQSAMNKQPFTGSIHIVLGGILFIGLIGIIASTSSTGSDIMLWMLLAMWLLFIMFNGSSQVSGFLSSISPSTPANSASTSQKNMQGG
jgi:hypothetical protein